MITSDLWLIYLLVFGAALLGVQGVYWVVFKERREQKQINRRLALTAELANPAEVLQVLRRERGVDVLDLLPSLEHFKELVVQSGVRFNGRSIILMAILPALLFFVLLSFTTGSNAFALAGPAAAAARRPAQVGEYQRDYRHGRRSLPDA